MFGAALFDLDGTLLDTLEDLARSTNAALRALGFPEHPVPAYARFVGDGIKELARRALPAGSRDAAVVERCVAAIRAVYGVRWAEHTRPYPGIPELLDALTARRLPLAVLSNKPDDLTTLAVSRLLATWRFAAVHGARPHVPLKPHPAGALHIARELDLAPERIVYLGDTRVDMETARAAGMHPVGVLWGFRDAEELRDGGAAELLAHPGELLALLEQR